MTRIEHETCRKRGLQPHSVGEAMRCIKKQSRIMWQWKLSLQKARGHRGRNRRVKKWHRAALKADALSKRASGFVFGCRSTLSR